MPQFLRVAEKVYKNLIENKEFTGDSIENLNHLIIEVRKEIKGTTLKLLYNYIDFEECLNRSNQHCKVKLDISLIPKIKHEDEFILWLAGFIERITTVSDHVLYPDISPTINVDSPYHLENTPHDVLNSSEKINSYFKSDEFIEVFNKNHS